MHKAKIILTLDAGPPKVRDHFRPKVTLEDIRAAQDIVKDIDSLLSKYEDKSDEY